MGHDSPAAVSPVAPPGHPELGEGGWGSPALGPGAAAGLRLRARALPYRHSRHGAGNTLSGAGPWHSVATPIRSVRPCSPRDAPLALPRSKVSVFPLWRGDRGWFVPRLRSRILPAALAGFGVHIWGHTHGTSPAVLPRLGSARGPGGPGGPCPAHLAEVPGDGGDVVAGALVDEALLRQHVLVALVLISEENRVLCGDSERWGRGSASYPPSPAQSPPTPLPRDVPVSDQGWIWWERRQRAGAAPVCKSCWRISTEFDLSRWEFFSGLVVSSPAFP